MNYEYFYNDKYFILKALFEHEIKIDNEVYVGISQLEISKITGIGLNKINSIIKDLKDNNYIDNSNYKPQKICITKKGYSIINNLK